VRSLEFINHAKALSWNILPLTLAKYKNDAVFVKSLRTIIENIVTQGLIPHYLNYSRFIALNKKPTITLGLDNLRPICI